MKDLRDLKDFTIHDDPRGEHRLLARFLAHLHRICAPRAYKLRGYLAHKKPRPLRKLQQDFAFGPTAVVGGGRFLSWVIRITQTGRCARGGLGHLDYSTGEVEQSAHKGRG